MARSKPCHNFLFLDSKIIVDCIVQHLNTHPLQAFLALYPLQDKNLKLHFPCGFEIPNLKGLAIHKVKSQERIINYSSLFFLHT